MIPLSWRACQRWPAKVVSDSSMLIMSCRHRVADRWRARLGELAWVRTRDEAIDEGWFAAIDDQLRDRWGHVLVALRGDWAIMTRTFPREFTLDRHAWVTDTSRDAGATHRGLSGRPEAGGMTGFRRG